MTWLGSMPSRWELRSPKSLFEERRTPNLPDDVHLTPSQKYGVLPQSEYIELTGGSVVLNLTGQNTMKHVEPDDFIIHLRSFQGGLEHARQPGKVSTAYTVIKLKNSTNPGFFRWLLKSSAFIQELQTTTNQLRDGQSIRWSDFVKVPLPTPPLDEQRAITDYLDRETQKIDELINEQRGLNKTLRERRRSLVTRAVTLGIDEGELTEVEDRTIGEVPLGWEIRPLKNWMKSLDGLRVPLSATERADRSGVYDYYGASGVIDHVDDYLFEDPLVLVSEDGANLLLRSTPIAFVASGKYWVNNHAHVFRPEDGLVRFWAERIEALDVAPFVTGSAQPKLTASALGRIRLSAPADPAERRRISTYLDEQTSRIDELISESEDLIALSQERRAALITAVVTGQIDVRSAA